MLILTRRSGEALMADVDGKIVEFRILEVKGNQVRVGINADRDVEVHREEIWQRIENEKAPVQAKRTPKVSYKPSRKIA